MDMTPEKLAFIKGQSKPEATTQVTPPPKAEEKIIEVATSPAETPPASDPAPVRSRRTSRRSPQEVPQASDVLDQLLVPVTIRLPHRTAQALRRAYLEQRLKHAKPDTQQEIVEEALGDWLSRHGFML